MPYLTESEHQELAEKLQQQQQITDETLPDRPSAAEVARWLGKSRNAIYFWVRAGLIPCKRVGVRGSIIFEKAALLKWAKPEEGAA